jgi:hypothetical protein
MKTSNPKMERAPQCRMLLGIKHADITPPMGIYHRMWGAAKHDRATGAHDHLRATVAALGPVGGDGIAQLLVSLDHCVMGVLERRALMAAISAGCRMPEDRITVVFSHTRAAGLMGLDRVGLPGGDLIPAYLDFLGKECGRLAAEAISSAIPVWGVYGSGRCDLARYRDFFDEDTCEYVVGYTPGRKVDDTVIVARFTDFSAPRDDAARAGCGNRAKSNFLSINPKPLFASCFYKALTRPVVKTRIRWIPNSFGLDRCIHIHPGQV